MGVCNDCVRKSEFFMVKEIFRLFLKCKACEKEDKNEKPRAIPVNRRSTPSTLKKIKEMEYKLLSTLCLWPENAESVIRNAEDKLFLQSIRGDRSASFGSYDKIFGREN
jgi:hypothetical protein